MENNFKKSDKQTAELIRFHYIHIFSKFLPSNFKFNDIDKELLFKSKILSEFWKNHPDILFTRADKGNVTVAVDRISYVNNINILLSDESTYIKIKRNPVKNIENTLN